MALRTTKLSMKATLDVLRQNGVAITVSSLIVAACVGSADNGGLGGSAGSGGGRGKSSGSAGSGPTSTGWGGTSIVGTGNPATTGMGGAGGSAGAPGTSAGGSAGGPRGGSGGAAGRGMGGGSVAGGGGSAGRGGSGSGDAGVAPPGFIDTTRLFKWIAQDIVTARATDQPFQRYLSLVHLRNAGASAADMDLYRAAMIKSINALSQGTRIVVPRSIDPYQTVYRIDLRDLEWDAQPNRADKWNVLVNGDPYAIEYLEDDAQTTKQLTKSNVPLQSGNWLVFAGLQPPLYNDVAGIPTRLVDLENQLGVNIALDIQREQVSRSGFASSATTIQNRVLERHDAASGGSRSLWITYDFASAGGRKNVFSHPLDFQQDASEIMYSLPNGLFGYMIVDALGNRLNTISNAIEKDVSQRDGTVTAGISCVSCHDKGPINKQDEVEPFVQNSFDFDARTKDLVSALYSVPDRFKSLVDSDATVYAQQLAAMAPAPTVTGEPASIVFHRFEADVDLKTAASELGFTANQLQAQLGRLNPDLAPLQTGVIKRDTFRARFAQTVCLLNIGLANDPACRR